MVDQKLQFSITSACISSPYSCKPLEKGCTRQPDLLPQWRRFKPLLIFTTSVTLDKVLNLSEANIAYSLLIIHSPFFPLQSDPNSAQGDNRPNKTLLHFPASFAARVGYGMRF